MRFQKLNKNRNFKYQHNKRVRLAYNNRNTSKNILVRRVSMNLCTVTRHFFYYKAFSWENNV